MSDTELIALLPALRAGNPVAADKLVGLCSDWLPALLRSRFPYLDADILSDAAHDALLALILHPERYDPERGAGPVTYLGVIAQNRVKDALRAIRRRQEISGGNVVELAMIAAHNQEEERIGDPETLDPDILRLLEETLPDPRDRLLWDMICHGRTEVAEVAPVLEITHLPPEQQQAEWKRNRDRIIKRVQRKRKEFGRLLYGEI